MKMLKRFEEPLDVKLIEDKGIGLINRFIEPEDVIELLETSQSQYGDFIVGVLNGTPISGVKHSRLKGCFIHYVKNKFKGNIPKPHVHVCYFKHINPKQTEVVGTYPLNSGHFKEGVLEEIELVTRSISRPALTYLSDDLFTWLNQMLFRFSSRVIKVDFTYEEKQIAATIRYVQPGETNPDISVLCRADSRLIEHYKDIASDAVSVIKVVHNYHRCGGYLNVNQVVCNLPRLERTAVLNQLGAMKETGYPTYATLQVGIAKLGNVFRGNVSVDGLTDMERNVLLEAAQYVPWVQSLN